MVSASGAQAVDVNVERAKTDVREGSGGGAEQGGDVVAGDVVPAGAHKVGAKGRHWRKARGADVLNSANDGLGGACHSVPAAAVTDDLSMFPVLLGVERKELWVAWFRSAGVAVSNTRWVEPMSRVTSASMSREFTGALQCSPGRRR